jgi:membrane associated rhomboid family serine protease
MRHYVAKQLIHIAFYPLAFLIFIWTIFIVQEHWHHNFTSFGVLPREISGLLGVVTSIFVHGDWDHLLSNSLPLLILGMLLFYFYKKIAKTVFFWTWIVSGLWLWVGGRNHPNYPVYHIGASTLIYGLATFLFFSGVFRKHLSLMGVSALVVFLYGSIMWGIFPLKPEVSWEGHLFGALAGVLVAFSYRNEGPQRRKYDWEEESEEEDPELIPETGPVDEPQQEIKVNYIYKSNPFHKDKPS